MLKMQSNKATGETCIMTVASGHRARFMDIHNAVAYVGVMKGLYVVRHRRAASEPYPVRSLNPGRYPVRVNKNEIRRRYGNGKL